MHVHATHPDGEAKFWIEPQVELAIHQGLSDKVVTSAIDLVRAHREEIHHARRRPFGH